MKPNPFDRDWPPGLGENYHAPKELRKSIDIVGDAFAMAFMDTMNRASMIEIKLTEDELDEICTKEANRAASPELRRQRQRLLQVEPPAAKATRQAKIAAAMNARFIEEGGAS